MSRLSAKGARLEASPWQDVMTQGRGIKPCGLGVCAEEAWNVGAQALGHRQLGPRPSVIVASIQTEIYVLVCALPVNGGHLRFTSQPDAGE